MSDYKVALEITAAGNVEQFLSTIASRLLGIHAKTKEIEKSLGNWGKLIGGATLAMAGLETLKAVDHIAKAGGELQRQANIFRSAGNSMQDTAKAISGAFEAIQKVPGVDAVDAMRRYREIAGATQDNAGSLRVLPDFLRAQVVYGTTTGANAEEGMQRLAKMIELRQGAINRETHKIEPERFSKELDVAVKALQVGQGLITANDLQMLVKQAGPMAKGMDPMRFWSIYLASLEDMGGARTGTAMTAAARQILGGIMTPKVADEWERVGMLNEPGKGWNMKKGHVDIWDAKQAIRGYETFRDEGFQEFIEKFVRPALNKAGYKSDNEVNAELYKFGSTETARRLYSMYLTGNEQVEAEQKKIKQALGLDSFDSIFKGGDYKAGVDALAASIKTLEEALGGPAGQAIGAMATKLAEGINKAALFAQAHPQLVEIGTYAITAASGLAILAGSLLAVTAALRLGGWIGGASAVAGAASGAAATAGEGAAAGAAASGMFGSVVKKLGALGAVIGLTQWLDPDGNFGGFTSPVDEWFKKNFGFDPSNIQLPSVHVGEFDPSAAVSPALKRDLGALGLLGSSSPEAKASSPQAMRQALDYGTIAEKDYGDRKTVFHGDLEAARENSRAGALSKMPMPPPIVNLNTQVDLQNNVKVSIDGRQIAAQIEAQIVKNHRVVDSAAGHDGRASWAPPDLSFA